MNMALRHQLTRLDRALLALLDERARLVAEAGGDAVQPPLEDLLRRSSGDFPGDLVGEVFRCVHRGCVARWPREEQR